MTRITLHRAALAAGAITATVAIACLGVAQEEQHDPPAHIETAQEQQRADAQTNTSKTDSTPSASAASNTAQEEQRATAQTNTSNTDSTPSASEAEPTPAPQEYPSDGFRAVSAGGRHSCGLRAGGAIVCWGSDYSPIGYAGQTNAPDGAFTAVSTGEFHTCGLRNDGAILCWGDNRYRQSDAPAGSFTTVSAGQNHSCAIRAGSGAIECWGSNEYGQSDALAGGFVAVSAGGRHTCGLLDSGAVECWGAGGAEDSGWRDFSQAVAPAGRFSAVSAGGSHTCGLRETGAVECWGYNRYGQTDAPTGRFSAVSAGDRHTCGLRETGAVECWGDNRIGILGYSGQSNAPAGIFRAVSAGGHHTCGVRETGEIECWGDNHYRQSSAPLSGSTIIPPVGGESGQMTIDEYAVWCSGFEILGDPNEVATSWHEVERALATVLEQLEHVAARAPAELESYHGTAMEMIEEMLDFAHRQDGEYDQDAVSAALLPLLFVYAGRIDDTKADLTPSTRAKLEAAGC